MTKRRIEPWALGISIIIIVFLVGMIILTISVSRVDFHLVTDNYYEVDKTYQQHIDMKQRTSDLESLPTIAVDRESETCVLSFPMRERFDDIVGDVTFFRISDAAHDVVRPLQLNDSGQQHLSVSNFQTGQWIVKLRWTANDQDYYLEQRVFIQ